MDSSSKSRSETALFRSVDAVVALVVPFHGLSTVRSFLSKWSPGESMPPMFNAAAAAAAAAAVVIVVVVLVLERRGKRAESFEVTPIGLRSMD